jgi:chemotaxis protein CheD
MAAFVSTRASERVVGVADLKVSASTEERLITYALGSCLGIVVYDPVVSVAGMLHVMLPTGTIDPAKMQEKPAMFVDSGIPLLFKECYKLGAKKERMQVKVAGGAHAGASEARRSLSDRQAQHDRLAQTAVEERRHDSRQ